MSSDISQGRTGPYIPVSVVQPGAISIGDARRIALAFALGEYRPDEGRHGRSSHRGMLPDVDFSQAVRLPRRSILGRIAQAFGRRSLDAVPAPEPMPVDEPLRLRDGSQNRTERRHHKPTSRAA